MPGRVGEVARQFCLAQHASRGAIHFARAHTRSHRRNRGLLRSEHRLIESSSLTGRLPDVHSSCAIRAITGEYNTKITDHEPAPGKARLRRPTVHNRRTLSRSEDRGEGHAFGSGTTSLVLHGGRSFDLAHTRPNLSACNPEKTGAKFNSLPDALDLGSIFHHARAFDKRRRGAQARL